MEKLKTTKNQRQTIKDNKELTNMYPEERNPGMSCSIQFQYIY